MKTSIYWQDPGYPSRGKDFIKDPSLILDLPLYKLDGASFISKDAYGHLCVATGALWTPRGRSFDGDDDIDCGNDASFDVHIWSLEGWLDYSSGTAFITKRGTMATFSSEVDVGSEYIIFSFNDGSWHSCISDVGSVPPNAWAHIVGTWDGTYIRIYRNGELIKTSADFSAFTPPTIADPVYIGRYTTAYIIGTIGEARIYNRVLTPLEIQHNYLATKWRYQ